jgi:ABC-type transport system involved in multi-copper enzyme maturation permease subunit
VLFVRWLAVVPPALVLLWFSWTWWSFWHYMPGYASLQYLGSGLTVVEQILLTYALAFSPALLAGTLAGEQVDTTLALLLASRVSSREIVLARLTGRLSVVGVILLPSLPLVMILAALCELGPARLALLLVLPVAVAFGGGGLALAASAVVRRGRDALLLVYLAVLLLLLVPLLGSVLPPAVGQWLDPLNPYLGIAPLLETGASGPGLRALGLWSLLGVAGILTAAWRLQPAFLSDGRSHVAHWFRSRRRVPPLGERPLLWKELYITPTGSLNHFVRWLGILVVVAFLGTNLVLAGLIAWWTWAQPDARGAAWALSWLELWTGISSPFMGMVAGPSLPVSWLIQWALGLQAAVAVASERERGTWDALLASPLEGREIVGAKIAGVLHGLRWFIAAVVLAWTLALLCGALGLGDYIMLVGYTLAASVFMVATGIHFSLSCPTAAQAMTLTLVVWPATLAGAAVIGAIIGVVFCGVMALPQLIGGANAGTVGQGFWAWFDVGSAVGRLVAYVLAALLVAGNCRRHFDQLAGRSFPAPRWRPRPRRVQRGPRPYSPRTGPAC